jgi:hypothetical protein
MATKHTDSCLQKAANDEPIFVLRGQDVMAPRAVLLWMADNTHLFSVSPAKMDEAYEQAKRMAQWPNTKAAD